MKHALRCAVAAAILAFAWKDSVLTIRWPPAGIAVEAPKPDAELIAIGAPVAKIVAGMLPADRQHLSAFYDAMAFVLLRDGERREPIISDTDKFTAFHSGSLNLAIEKKNVGKYPGLDRAIDMTFVTAVGADQSAIDEDKRNRMIATCGVLSWIFGIHHE